MLQHILENKSCTDAMRAFVSVGVTEGIVDSEHRGVLRLGDRDLHGAAGMETFVEVHAVVIEVAVKQAAFEDVTTADQEPFSPAIFGTKDILVFGKGVGDEVACEGDAVLFGEVPIISSGNTQLGRQFELICTLVHSPLQGAVRIDVRFE